MKKQPRAFTLVELLVVIAIIGVLVALLLPAVQAAREAARRAQCQHHLVQIGIAINNYEMAHTAYPVGTVAATGPVRSVSQGYHHGWTIQLLPYVEQSAVYRHVDPAVSVYDSSHARVRTHNVAVYRCPSAWLGGDGYSDYAGLQHDRESPIDTDNDGVFFLNSRVRYQDLSDGTSQTLFVGEKLATQGDLGWMSGTRAILRNTGTPLNAAMQLNAGQPALARPNGPPGTSANVSQSPASDGPADPPAGDDPSDQANGAETKGAEGDAAETTDAPSENPIRFGEPVGPLAVGGFASDHPAGANFAFGDGSVRYLSETISMRVYQQLGNRHDGQLLDGGF